MLKLNKMMDGETTIMASSGIPQENAVTLFEGITLLGTIELNAVQTGIEYIGLDGILYDSNNKIIPNYLFKINSEVVNKK